MAQENSSTQSGAKKKIKASKKSKSNSIETLEDAFIHELSDMRNAEQQLTKALPKMAKAASDEQLAEAFETHYEETERQIELIDKAVKTCKIKLKREKCDAMEGLIKEGSEIIKTVEEGAVRDAMLIAAGQKVEHYEIASYGALVALAKRLGFDEAAELLDQILDQEKQTDRKLNQLAKQGINDEASEEGRFNDDEDEQDYGRGRSYGGGRYSSRYNQDKDRRYSRSNRNENYDDNYSSSSRGYNDDRSSRLGSRGDYDDRYSSRSESSGKSRFGRPDRGQGWFGGSEEYVRSNRYNERSGGGRR